MSISTSVHISHYPSCVKSNLRVIQTSKHVFLWMWWPLKFGLLIIFLCYHSSERVLENWSVSVPSLIYLTGLKYRASLQIKSFSVSSVGQRHWVLHWYRKVLVLKYRYNWKQRCCKKTVLEEPYYHSVGILLKISDTWLNKQISAMQITYYYHI